MDDGEWSIEGPRTIDIDGVLELDAECTAGRLDVLAHAEEFTRIDVTEVTGSPIRVALENGVLVLRHRTTARGFLQRLLETGTFTAGKLKDRCVATILVPAGTRVRASNVVGDCLVAGVAADVQAGTVAGSILVDGTTGRLGIDTVSGEAIVRNHTGAFASESVNGDVTASGAIDDATASSVTGELALDLLGTPQTVRADTVSGSVRIRIPDGVGVDLEAQTVTGSVHLNDQSFHGVAKKLRAGDGPAAPRVAIRSEGVSGRVAVFNAPSDAPAGAAPEEAAR
ncbi:DUF4097 domain-containing protein [Arthrobacter sp. JSM 101049]|uniref:DUF4097 family beta strand repeat-containing protein n=1 Tax=Arthrobacter sp. JSM 101049 TaxID=929097 RepID=UPI0035617CB7